jgi:hypothetical protein
MRWNATSTTFHSGQWLIPMFLWSSLPPRASTQSVQHRRQQGSPSRYQSLQDPPRRALHENETSDTVATPVEPVVCPGPDCVELDDVDHYVDWTGLTQYSVLCYKPPYCGNHTDSDSTGGEGGCPLYVWLDGTSQNDVLEIPDRYFLREMVGRGFVSCVAGYDDSPVSYLEGCSSYHTKARDIFDPNQPGSLLSQLCPRNGTASHADCATGLAVHGWGQGAHLAVLAADYAAVTASLQFGNGNLNGVLFVETNVTCVDSENINPRLPPPRRRSVVGEDDQFFNRPTYVYTYSKRRSPSYGLPIGRHFSPVSFLLHSFP